MISSEQILFRLAAATILGGFVGLERGRLEQAAGLRTHAMVALGSCLIMIVSAFGFTDVEGMSHVDLDPSRVAAQVVSGIGFLGAGTIIMRREVVRGLTTAASVWAVAGIGLAVGGGMYLAAVCATAIGLLVLAGVKPLERRLYVRQRMRVIKITVRESKMPTLPVLRSAIEAAGASMHGLLINPGESSRQSLIEVRVGTCNTNDLMSAVDSLQKLPGIVSIESSLGLQMRQKSSKKRASKIVKAAEILLDGASAPPKVDERPLASVAPDG